MNFYEQAAELLQSLETNVKRANKTLAKSPEGSLIVKKCKGYLQYYWLNNKKKKYLNKEQKELIKSLGIKAYTYNYRKYALNEMEALKAYFAKRNANIQNPEEYLITHPGISKIISPMIFKGPKDLKEWANAPYDQSDFRPDELSSKTAQGHYVRSKSECIIANALYMNGVAYRYESKLIINGKIYRPDFEIYTKKGRHIIWEHFGLLDNKEYVKKSLDKIAAYISAGYIPGATLIITADEKRGTCIDSFYVNKLIKLHLFD